MVGDVVQNKGIPLKFAPVHLNENWLETSTKPTSNACGGCSNANKLTYIFSICTPSILLCPQSVMKYAMNITTNTHSWD